MNFYFTPHNSIFLHLKTICTCMRDLLFIPSGTPYLQHIGIWRNFIVTNSWVPREFTMLMGKSLLLRKTGVWVLWVSEKESKRGWQRTPSWSKSSWVLTKGEEGFAVGSSSQLGPGPRRFCKWRKWTCLGMHDSGGRRNMELVDFNSGVNMKIKKWRTNL